MTFKDEMYVLCQEAIAGVDDWSFTAGYFKNKSLKHTDLLIDPGFYFDGLTESCSTQPCVAAKNKKEIKLYKEILNYNQSSTRLINLKTELKDYRGYDCLVSRIYKNPRPHMVSPEGVKSPWPETFVGIDKAPAYIDKLIKDGMMLLEKKFKTKAESEADFLANLPPPTHQQYDLIVECLVKIILGDFEYIHWFMSDEVKTKYPKPVDKLEKIAAALPELKRRYEATGSVI